MNNFKNLVFKVWAIICDFLGDLPESKRSDLVGWLYDDMCHLKPFSGNCASLLCANLFTVNIFKEKIEQDQSEMTKAFAGLKKAVDKLHFHGHRGAYCQKYCDPYKIKELSRVNTTVCKNLSVVSSMSNLHI